MSATFRSSVCALLFFAASLSLAQDAPQAGPPYRVGGNVTRPEKISGSPPVYSIEARKARVHGVVILEAVIDEQGNVMDVKVVKGLPMGLDEAAVAAVQSWKFDPARLDGTPVPVYYTLTVNFTMSDGKEPEVSPAARLLGEFAQKHPEFETLLRGRRLPEALAYLDGLDAAPEVRFARTFVLAGLRRYDDALQEARAYDGPQPEMGLLVVAGSALAELTALSPAEEARAGIIEAGLQAAAAALEARQDFKDAMLARSRLLREKAKLATDPQRAALLDEASELEERAGSNP